MNKMSEDEATDKLKELVIRCKECKFATCENCEINWNEVQAIETILAELEKKDKIIDAMALQLSGISIWDNQKEEPIILMSEDAVKEYFERKVENE